ncbi:MAG: ABC transporter ATP-binding protein [Hyphomonas sp.]
MNELKIENVSRSYGKHTVVDAVSLSLKPGLITALLGGSGAGKSTLLRLIAGLEPVDKGVITLGDKTLSSTKRTIPAEKRRIGLIFQDFALFPHLTAIQNICFGLKHLPRDEAIKLAEQWLVRLRLNARAKAFPHQLSGGEQQRVAIARALAPKPDAILMDEPFSGLDPSLRGDVRQEALAAIRDAGIPALLVTHDPAEALESADHIAILRGGKVLQQGPAQEIYLYPESAQVAGALGPINAIPPASPLRQLLDPNIPITADISVRPEGLQQDAASKVHGHVIARQLTGPLMRLVVEVGSEQLIALVPRLTAPSVGDKIGLRLDPALTFIFQSDQT